MSQSIRVLICDDSSVMRRLIKTALNGDPQIDVVFEARNGKEAVENLYDVHPDIILMDVEMPIMDGIDAVRAIRKRSHQVPIVMCSSLTTHGGEATLDALDAGANDFVAKPVAKGKVENALHQLELELIPKLKALVPKAAPPAHRNSAPATNSAMAGRKVLDGNPAAPIQLGPAVVVGVSTGGPAALSTFVSGIQASCKAPIAITQHMPAEFMAPLANRLASHSPFPVEVAQDGMEFSAGKIYLAPGDFHLCFKRDKFSVACSLNKGPKENSCRPAVDTMFRSAAGVFGSSCLGIVLTGMGADGKSGSQAIKSQGGKVFVQDEASSVVWGMPGAVAQSGLADRILPLADVAPTVNRTIPKLAKQPNKTAVAW